MKFINCNGILVYLMVYFGLEGLKCPFVASFTLLGLNGYGQTKVRTIVEMYKMYDRSFDFISRNTFFTNRKKIDVTLPQWSDEIEDARSTISDRKLDEAMKNEFSHVFKQANYGTSLTDLQTTLFVQYMSLSYSFEFNRGFLHFHSKNDTKKSLACLQLAYYLALFGSESGPTEKSITNILRIKYPAANEKFLKMNESLQTLQNKSKVTRVEKFEEEVFSNEEFQNEMKLVTAYFREVVLGEPNVFDDEYYDLDENITLWAMANKFVNRLYASYNTQYYNMDSGKKNLFASNIGSTLRDIELFKAEQSFSKSVLRNLHLGFVDEFLVVRRWSENRTLIFTRLSSDLEDMSSEEETANFLGITRFESDDIRAEMIVFNNYQKGYHYASLMKFHSHFEFIEHWLPFIRSDFLESDKMGYELKYVYWQSIEATYLTELFSILFVQYMSAIYAFRLAYGSAYFQEIGDEDNAEYNARTSYYLAWFAVKSDATSAAIEKILRTKYPKLSVLFTSVANAMARISSVVWQQIAGNYSSSERRMELFGPHQHQLLTEKLNSDVRTMNTFFRHLLIGKKNVMVENVVDLKGSKKLWRYAQKLHSFIDISPDEKFENPITGQNDMHLSTVCSIVQLAELLSVENKFSHLVRSSISEAGLIDEIFITKLFRDEFGEEMFRFEQVSITHFFPPMEDF